MSSQGSSTSAATPCGTCHRCGGTLYANLTHTCQTSVRIPSVAVSDSRLPDSGMVLRVVREARLTLRRARTMAITGDHRGFVAEIDARLSDLGIVAAQLADATADSSARLPDSGETGAATLEEFAAIGVRETRLQTIRAVMDLMQESAQPHWHKTDAIAPYTNGYGMWFIGRENFTNGQMLGTAPLKPEEILARIEAREASRGC